MSTGPPRAVHPIERRSYQVLRSRVDTAQFPRCTRAVIERVIHASADLDYVTDLVVSAEDDLEGARRRLLSGAAVVTDVEMVAAGITAAATVCRVREAIGTADTTRSAAGFRLALTEVGPGAVWVIGNAPTALAELLRLDARPSLVIGLPVGFVGAVDAKQALRTSGLPAISNCSEKGGSAVAAAALNALLYVEDE